VTARLSVEDLAFGYPGHVVGRGVSFVLAGGEVMCLLGPNGGGKTTMFRTILGLLEPLAGTVRVDGAPTVGWSHGQRARAFGYVPQAVAGMFPYTVREIVLMGRTARVGLFATPSRHDRDVADGAIATLGIERLADRPYTEVSGGERQLALVARALVQEPSVLVMDEPTASLDFGNQVRVLAEVQALAARGMAVILSTHDPDQAFLCADRVAVLHEGGLFRLGSPADVLNAATLREVYGVEVTVHEVEMTDGRRTRMCLPSLSRAAPHGRLWS
jgi:iron complex transport system ATP-binding protein